MCSVHGQTGGRRWGGVISLSRLQVTASGMMHFKSLCPAVTELGYLSPFARRCVPTTHCTIHFHRPAIDQSEYHIFISSNQFFRVWCARTTLIQSFLDLRVSHPSLTWPNSSTNSPLVHSHRAINECECLILFSFN
jgi:hypothetical protein